MPVIVVVDGSAYHEGDEFDSGAVYDLLAGGATVSTAAPAPGEVLAHYEALTAAGATAIVSIHTGSAYSGTVGAAASSRATRQFPSTCPMPRSAPGGTGPAIREQDGSCPRQGSSSSLPSSGPLPESPPRS